MMNNMRGECTRMLLVEAWATMACHIDVTLIT